VVHEDKIMDHRPSIELLESTHAFPGVYRIKAIGRAEADFSARVIAAATRHLAAVSDIDHSIRATRGGRHVSVTLDISVSNADQIRAIYAEIHQLEGLTLLL